MVTVRESRAGVVFSGTHGRMPRDARLAVKHPPRGARVHRLLSVDARVEPSTACVHSPVATVRAPVARIPVQARAEVLECRRTPRTVEHLAGRARQARAHIPSAVEISCAVRTEVLVSSARHTLALRRRVGAFAVERLPRNTSDPVEHEFFFANTPGGHSLATTFEPGRTVSPVSVKPVLPIEAGTPRGRRAVRSRRRFATAAREEQTTFAHAAADNAMRFTHEIFMATGGAIRVSTVRSVLAQRGARFVRAEVRVAGRQRHGGGARRRAGAHAGSAARHHGAQLRPAALQSAPAFVRRVRIFAVG